MHPILWSWGGFSVYSYGVVLAIAVLLATTLALRRAGVIGVSPAQLMDLVIWSVAGGIVGARLVYVTQNWPLYRETPWEILRLDHGGLVFYGGLLGGLITAVALIRRMQWSLWPVVDLLVPYLALAQGIGRIGCFLNGCCYGRATTLPWGVRFPADAVARHPTQLYESAVLLMMALWLERRSRRPDKGRGAASDGRSHRKVAPGSQLAWYVMLYGSWRFAVEWIRGDNHGRWPTQTQH